MTAVWKFPFEVNDRVRLTMPEGAKPLHAEMQNGVPCMWAVVDDTRPNEVREFVLRGTGHPLPPVDLIHISTFQMGPFVWHVFEETR